MVGWSVGDWNWPVALILIVMGLTWVVWRSGAPLPHGQAPEGIAEATEDARHLRQGHVGH